jgi:hypothetical protein
VAGVDVIHWYGWGTTASLGGLDIRSDTATWAAVAAYI